MKRKVLPILFYLAGAVVALGQTDHTLYVRSFPGGDVGSKVANAMAACDSNTTIPCLLVIDPSLAGFNPGSMPTMCSHCFLIDYRNGPPTFSSSVNYNVPVPVGPAPVVPPIKVGTPFIVTNGANPSDCGIGGGTSVNVCIVTNSGVQVVGGGSLAGVTDDGAGNLKAASINASVNSQLNVQAFGAVGDCITDDEPAVFAAQTAAQTYAVGFVSPAALYFPKPSGGCYYFAETLPWTGVNLLGQPSGTGQLLPHSYGVSIKGAPGKDILEVGDPGVASHTWNVSWVIRDIGFLIDASTPATSATVPNLFHRWPGRWFDDGAMTASSATFSSVRASIGCSDVGQNIVVGGAGATVTTTTLAAAITTTTQSSIQISGTTSSSWPVDFGYLKIDSEIVMYVGTQANGLSTLTVYRGQAGTTAATHSNGATMTVMGNLITTISAVSPCWSVAPGATTWKAVTLAAPATTTVSSAHSYISILDLPIDSHIGPCGIAFDNMDALSTDWPNPSATVGSQNARLENVIFTESAGSQSAATNPGCGLFTQGVWDLYGLTAERILAGNTYSIAQTNAEINSYYTSYSDFESWKTMNFFDATYPWISYNGGEGSFNDVEITALAGPQFMKLGNLFADNPSWQINLQEMESWSPTIDSRFGLRLEGTGYNLTGIMDINADANNDAFIDTSLLACPTGCFTDQGTLHVYGAGNNFTGMVTGSRIDDEGIANTFSAFNNSSPTNGQPASAQIALRPQKGMPGVLGAYEPDFADAGYPSTPYRKEDLFLWPYDFIVGTAGTTPWSTLHQSDTNSISGGEVYIASGSNITQFQPFQHTGLNLTIGSNFPASSGTLYYSALCPAGTSTLNVGVTSSDGYTQGYGTSPACSTSLANYSVSYNLTGHTGNVGIKNFLGTGVWVAWAYFQPAPQLPVGTLIGGSSPVAGPSSGTGTGDVACYSNTTGLQADCNTQGTINVINATSGPTWNFGSSATGSNAQFNLKIGDTSHNNLFGYYMAGTRYWYHGTIGSTNFQLFDSVSGRSILNFPSNTMPSGSYGGNSSGPILGGLVTPGTFYSAAGTPLPSCASGTKGARATVIDATSPTYMGAYASGGGITVQVICSYNGTTYSWLTE